MGENTKQFLLMLESGWGSRRAGDELRHAAITGNDSTLRGLLDQGVDINSKCHVGSALLCSADLIQTNVFDL
jgi:hypothetical protein